ncbi:MAG: PAS domain S-box protein [Gammaproteobacteria bacterium]|nr:PAS domain S-box protein [Gammaproteobacteria bacterium]
MAPARTPMGFWRYLAITAVPMSILLAMGFHSVANLRDAIDETKRELEGVHQEGALFDVAILLQQIRIQWALPQAESERTKKVNELMRQTLAIIDAAVAEGHSEKLRVRDGQEMIKKKAFELAQNSEGAAGAKEKLDAYSELIVELHLLMREVANGSQLVLDPEMKSHYLMDLVVVRFPGLVESLERLQILHVRAHQISGEDQEILGRKLYGVIKEYERQARVIRSNLQILDDRGVGGWGSELKSLRQMLTTTDKYVAMIGKGVDKTRHETIFKMGEDAISGARKAYREVAQDLNISLQSRVSDQNEELILILVGAGIAFPLLLVGAVSMYRRTGNEFEAAEQALQRLKSSETRQRIVVENMVDGLIAIDEYGLIQEFNPAAERIFGYKSDEVIGKNVNMLMPEPYTAEHDQYLDNYQQTGKAKIIGIGREVEGKRKDGSTFPIDLAVSAMNLDGKKFYSGIVRDITERKRIDKMKNEFVSTVSHELRTPLTSIRGALGLMAGGAAGEIPPKMNEMLKIATSNTERLLLLINDILDLQKIESGKMAFKFDEIELATLLKQAVEEHQAYATQRGVSFVITRMIEGAHLYADRNRMMQVMGNLMSNAAKFSEEGAKIEISAVRQGKDAARITVTDYGTGIPDEFQGQVFERFTQSDSSDTRKKGGTGLGLAIAKVIVEKHGGRISFISRVGVGTSFMIDLPVMLGASKSIKTKNLEEIWNEKTPRVLIVEDDPDVAVLIQRMLAEAGYDSDIAYDAVQARELIRKRGHAYRLITLDIMLPGEDGVSFLVSLRNDASARDIPVVVVSAKADEAKRELNGGAIGVLDWMDKPFDQQRLIAVVRQASKNGRRPRVLHVEDELDIFRIVSNVLGDSCELVSAPTLEEGRKLLESERFDLVLLDVGLPDGSGLDLLDIIERRVVPPRVIIFSAHDVSHEYAAKVAGVLVKSKTTNSELRDLIAATIEAQQ